LGGADAAGAEAARRAGLDLGLAFQGADDLLDETASAVQLGKSPGKDAAAGKATWIRVEGRVGRPARPAPSRGGVAGGAGGRSAAGAGEADVEPGPLKP
ncbi:MAG: polyprenyl synthetase family protein, partial [Krumholzibacteria bacterium]|nr:polyprenyl synthetase family protein [Candidatus Krumholzibacteria bacterium]